MKEELKENRFFPLDEHWEKIRPGKKAFSLFCDCDLTAVRCQKEINGCFKQAQETKIPSGGFSFLKPPYQYKDGDGALKVLEKMLQGAKKGEDSAIFIHFDWPCEYLCQHGLDVFGLNCAIHHVVGFIRPLCYINCPSHYLLHYKEEGERERRSYIFLP